MIPKKLVALVLDRDRGRCVLNLPRCLGAASVADHRANRGSGGSKVLDDARALIAACGLCNSDKADASGETRAELIRRGVIVEKAATNHQTVVRCAYTPVEYPDGARLYLLSDGRRVPEGEVPF
ncbi:hypothetical protein [Agromyces sp. NBRC 114283]|uniref:hypothetical protein n=1 Tax=Agromyces sp. NBRC 114283 TaxID=2994521 RepID=UPI0024A499E2|nr:hypothetical protein [Agromyces sp. NBRC 114283]GLU88911.1 hypothetical protein Agsp01_11660 [Agromyces sp. NBRC 114283]